MTLDVKYNRTVAEILNLVIKGLERYNYK